MTDYHDFVSLLYEACFASEAVDHYNLQGDGPAHQAVWQWLLHEQYTASLALIAHVRSHPEAIIASMGAPPATVPEEPPPKLLRAAELVEARFAFVTQYAVEAERLANERDGLRNQPRYRLKTAHSRCIDNHRLLANGGRCGCFYCLKTFDASEVATWVDEGVTALCPHCGIDTVLSEKADPIDPWFLKRMHAFWFKAPRIAFPGQPTLPVVIGHEVKTYRPEDVPEEFIAALERELSSDAVVEYEDMTEEQQRIVDAGNAPPAGRFPTGLSRDELIAWMKTRFGAE